MKAKRILSMVLALCLCLTMLPVVAMEAKAADPISMMVSYAQARVGKTGQQLGYTDEWCAFFACDCAVYAGQSKAIPYNGNAHTLYFAVLNAGGSVVSSPRAGDLVFYNCTACDTNGDGISMMHVGLVENENYTIEGNLDGSSYLTRTVKRKGINERYSHSSSHSTDNYVRRVFVRPNYSGSHTCNKGTYVYYEAAHPHYKCYKCSSCGSVWRNTAEPTTVSSCTTCVPKRTVDSRYSAYFPIAAYPLSTGKITVYNEGGTAYSNRYIDGSTDICIIWEIYTDGWCKVRYPSSTESSGYFDAYVPLSVFTDSTSPTSWVATNDYTTYKRSDIESTMHNVSNGAKGLLLKTDGYIKQIIHPVSGQSYYMMGWIAEPKQIHSSVSSLTLTLGGSSSQTIYVWSTGYYNGNTALYYSRSNSNISCSWGDWTEGKAPLTITANSRGTTVLTLGVKDSDTETVLDSITVTITVNAKSYTISFNPNGGTGVPGSQTKYHNTTLTLSNTKPTWTGHTFLGWSTSSTATSASYQPGGSFTINDNTTLYAVWKNGCEGNTHKYVYNVTGRPTSTSTGKIVGECGYCGATTSVLLPKLNTSDYAYKVTKAATCTATGTGRYTWNTTTYGGSYYFDETIPSTGHSYSYKATKTPTTSATGTLTGTCSKCSGTTTVTLPKLNTTDYTYSVRTAATCTSVGTGRYTWKTTTYGSFYFDVSLAKLGHSYSYKATKTPTTSATGTLTGTCSKCSGTTTVTLPKLNTTDYSYSVKTAATCTEAGSGRYTWKTTTYGSFYFDVTISKLGHNYSNGSCVRCGAEDPSAEKGKYEITNATGVAGSLVEVYVSITNNPGVISLRNTISYDTSALELISVQDCGLLAGYTTPSAMINSPYTLRWADSLATQNNTSNGRIVKLVFQIKDSVETGNYSISVTPVEARNVNGGSVAFNGASAAVTVIDCMIGDTDGDGEVTDWDAIVLNRYLAGWNVTIEVAAADVDDDGEVTDWDAIVLDRYLAGWNVTIG